jgi:tetratricopeptide (TPR) repeat protein
MKSQMVFLLGLLICTAAIASESDPNDPYKKMFDEAKVELSQGNIRTASKILKHISEKSNVHGREAFNSMIEILRKNDRLADATLELEKAVNEKPFDAELRLMLADCEIVGAKFEKALNTLSLTEKIIGNTSEVLSLRFVAYQKLNQHTEAINTLNQYLTMNPNDHNGFVSRSESKQALDKWSEALADALKAITLKANDEKALSNHAKVSLITKNLKQAELSASKCVSLYPTNAFCPEFLGMSLFEQKNYPGATAALRKAVDFRPNEAELRLRLAEAFALNGKPQESDSEYKELLKRHPSFEKGMKSWAGFLAKRTNIAFLANPLTEFNDNNPANIWAALELSKLYWKVEDHSKAVQVLKRASDKNDSDVVRFYLAHAFFKNEKYSNSVSTLRAIKSTNLNLEFHLGVSQIKLGKIEDAIESWRKIESTSSYYSKAQINVALAYEQLGQLDRAREVYQNLGSNSQFGALVQNRLDSIAKNEDRGPANQNTKSAPYFVDWELPQL